MTLLIICILLISCSSNKIKYKDLVGRWEIKELRNLDQITINNFRNLNMTFVDSQSVFIPYLLEIPMNSKMYCEWKLFDNDKIYIEDCRQNILTGIYDVFIRENKMHLKKGLFEINLVKINGDWMDGGYPANF